jgi:O-antigen/teichoic acid export membrane protein
MIVFGLKGVMGGIPNLIVLQGTSLLIAGNLGPEALAVFSRPLALIRNLELFILKFAAVLTPTTGSLQSSGRLDDLAEMLITSTRTAAYLAMPILVFFSFSGDAILSIWMGLHYQPEMVLPILSIGLFFPLIRHSVMSILMGMDMHGKIGFMSLMLTSVSFALSALVVESTGWTLNAASLVVGIPLSLGMGVSVIIFGCLKLKVPLTHFLGQVIKVPVLCSVPYALSLMVCRKMFAGKPVLEVVAGFLCAVALLGPLYWRYVIPETARKKAVDFIDSTIHSPFS